jgi:hypothetical protein
METTLPNPAIVAAKSAATAKTIVYWIATGIVALVLVSGGMFQVTQQAASVDGFVKLGYPVHFMILLGAWKVLGGLALLAPRLPRIKEWAYAGIFFDFSGAVVVNLVHFSAAFHVVSPLVLIGFLVASWALRPPSRVLAFVK